MNNTAPEAQTNTPNQPQGESIPGLVPAPEATTTNAAAAIPGAEIPTQTPVTENASVSHAEASAPTAQQQPREFQRTHYAPDPPKAEEIRAKQPAGQPETTTPTAAPGLEETPKPIENTNPEPTPTDTPTPAETNAPTETTTPEAVTPQDTPAQIDASGEVQTPTQNSSEDFAQTPTQPAEADNQAPAQAASEVEVLKSMEAGNAPLQNNSGQDKKEESEIEKLQNVSGQKMESQDFSEEAETDNQSPTPLIETFKKFDEMLKGAGENKFLQEVILNAAHTVAQEAATNEAIPANSKPTTLPTNPTTELQKAA